MQVYEADLPGVLIIELKIFKDARGFFAETYQKQRYLDTGLNCEFVQDNYSQSSRGTVRGLHFQIEYPQGKLVQVLKGEVFDVAVDLRRDSPNFGRSTGVRLSETNHRQLYIPPGFAHGFYVISKTADLWYKCTDLYHPEHERTLLWNDPAVGIDWPQLTEPILSEKDRNGTPLAEIQCYQTTPD